MLWTDGFRQTLQTGSYLGGLAPQFRLLVGSPCVVAREMLGEWEADVASVLEILSHPGTATFPSTTGDDTHIHGSGTWPTGHQYLYGVGLTTEISLGSARLNPRTFQYTGSSLSCGVSAWASQRLANMPPGCFARLQVRYISQTHRKTAETFTTDIEAVHDPFTSGVTEWEYDYQQFTDIFIGVYKGLKCAGGKYTASFASALEAAKTRKTDDHAERDNPDRYRWFAGCGSTAKTVSTFDGAEMSVYQTVELDITHDEAVESFFGNTWKKTEILYPGAAFGGDDYHYGGHDAYAGCALGALTSQCWGHVTNSSGKKTFVRYMSLGVGIGEPPSATLLKSHSVIVHMPAPGFYKRHVAAMEPSTMAAGSTIQNVCVVHGTPVTELVNTLYVQGYHRNMVPGIFARGYAERAYGGGPLDPLNHNEIMNAHLLFNRYFVNAAGRHPTKQDVPFRFTATRPSTNGLSDITRRTGKWGVFPRFKLGGWAVHVVIGNDSKIGMNKAVDFITEKHIESYEWSKQESDTIGGYNYVEYQTSDPDVPGSLSSDFRYPHIVRRRPAGGSETYHGWPQLGRLIVSTDDCAQGTGEAHTPHTEAGGLWGSRFSQYHQEYLVRDFWFAAREQCTLVLRGLDFAHIEPGDYVHVVIPGKRNRAHGFAGPELHTYILDSSGLTGDLDAHSHSDLLSDEFGNDFRYPPWLCVESHKDYVKGFVTLTLSRATTTNGRLKETEQTVDSTIRGIAEDKATDTIT